MLFINFMSSGTPYVRTWCDLFCHGVMYSTITCRRRTSEFLCE